MGLEKYIKLFSIGGGIIQTLLHLNSSIMYRGVDWVHIPKLFLLKEIVVLEVKPL